MLDLVAAAVLYLVLMDFSDRLHWLILIAACLVYGTVTLALFSVGAEIKASVQRILRAIEEIGRPAPGAEAAERPAAGE